MINNRYRRTLLFTLLLACVTIAAPESAGAAEKWLRLSSEHFDMLSCTSQDDSKQLLVELEQFREFFFHAFPQSRIYDPKPLIFVFDTEKQYGRYQFRTPDGKKRPSTGSYLSGLLQPRITILNRDIGQSLPAIFHEYVHALMRARVPKIPAWFNEGMAETFETFSVEKDTAIFGKAREGHIRTMRTTPLIPLNTLFAVDHNSPYYNESDMMNIFASSHFCVGSRLKSS